MHLGRSPVIQSAMRAFAIIELKIIRKLPFGLFLWDFEPIMTPDPQYSVLTYQPTVVLEQGSDPAVAVTAILLCQDHNSRDQRILENAGQVRVRVNKRTWRR